MGDAAQKEDAKGGLLDRGKVKAFQGKKVEKQKGSRKKRLSRGK